MHHQHLHRRTLKTQPHSGRRPASDLPGPQRWVRTGRCSVHRCCTYGLTSAGYRGGSAACAGGQASRTWSPTRLRRSSELLSSKPCSTRHRTAPPAVGISWCRVDPGQARGAVLGGESAVAEARSARGVCFLLSDAKWASVTRCPWLPFSGTAVMAFRARVRARVRLHVQSKYS